MIRLLAFVQMRINLINQLFSTGDTMSDLFKSNEMFFLFPNLKEHQKSERLPFTVS